MLRFDPTYYNALFFMGLRYSGDEHLDAKLMAWYGCLALRPDDVIAKLNRGETHARLGQFDEAKADYESALAARPDHPHLLSGVALSLATDPNEAMRDGIRAVELATTACKLTDYKDAIMIDALASGYAETGDFASAVKWSEKAVQLSPEDHRKEYIQHLERYRQGKPWRQE